MRKLAVTCALFGLLAGTPSAAIESVSGSYAGKLRCKGLAAGDFAKNKTDAMIGILDDGAGGIDLLVSDVGALRGFVLGSMRKPETGTLSAVTCSLDAGTLAGAAFHAEVKVKAGSDKASIKGSLILMDEGGSQAWLCRLKAKRVSPIPPKLEFCLL